MLRHACLPVAPPVAPRKRRVRLGFVLALFLLFAELGERDGNRVGKTLLRPRLRVRLRSRPRVRLRAVCSTHHTTSHHLRPPYYLPTHHLTSSPSRSTPAGEVACRSSAQPSRRLRARSNLSPHRSTPRTVGAPARDITCRAKGTARRNAKTQNLDFNTDQDIHQHDKDLHGEQGVCYGGGFAACNLVQSRPPRRRYRGAVPPQSFDLC